MGGWEGKWRHIRVSFGRAQRAEPWRERGREGGREGRRKGGRKEGREGGREGLPLGNVAFDGSSCFLGEGEVVLVGRKEREGGTEGGKEEEVSVLMRSGGREGGREGGRGGTEDKGKAAGA